MTDDREENNTLEPHISLITLGVADLARAVAFYRDGLGLPTHGDFPGVAFFPLRGTWLALYGRDELAADAAGLCAEQGRLDGGFSGVTIAHNVGSKADVDAVIARALAAGATPGRAARDTDWGGYSGYFADPDGHLWEVAWNPHLDLT